MAAQFIQREIIQYCCKQGADRYNGPVTPFIYESASPRQPVNILWVPATLGEDRFNHILPLLPWKCGCINSELCLFASGFHQEEKWKEHRKEMVQCLRCHEWYHCMCLGYTLRQVARTNLDCGCSSVLSRRSRHVQSRDRWVQQRNPSHLVDRGC